MSSLVAHGLESEDWRVRRESAAAVPVLLTRDAGGVDLQRLVGSLVGRLRDVSDVVIQGAITALSHVGSTVGEEVLLDTVGDLPALSRQLFRQHEARILNRRDGSRRAGGGTDFGLEGEGADARGTQAWKGSRSVGREGTMAGDGGSQSVHSRVHQHMTVYGTSTGGQQAAVAADGSGFGVGPTSGITRSSGGLGTGTVGVASSPGSTEFGFIPSVLVAQLRSDCDWKTRATAIENLHRCVTHAGDMAPVVPHVKPFVEFLCKLLEDHNFKIALTTLYIIGDMVAKLGSAFRPGLPAMIASLVNKFADNKIVIRQAAMKIIVQLMYIVTPKPVITHCLHHFSHDNQRVREEIVNVVTTALLTFTEYNWEFPLLVADLLTALRDVKAKVKYVTVEAYSIIAWMITPERILRLLREYGVEEETLQLLQLRFSDPTIPQLNSEGLVEHIISRSNTGTPRPPSSVPTAAEALSGTQPGSQFRSPSKSAPTALRRSGELGPPAGRPPEPVSGSEGQSIAEGDESRRFWSASAARGGAPGIIRTTKMPWERDHRNKSLRGLAATPFGEYDHEHGGDAYDDGEHGGLKRVRSYSETDMHVLDSRAAGHADEGGGVQVDGSGDAGGKPRRVASSIHVPPIRVLRPTASRTAVVRDHRVESRLASGVKTGEDGNPLDSSFSPSGGPPGAHQTHKRTASNEPLPGLHLPTMDSTKTGGYLPSFAGGLAHRRSASAAAPDVGGHPAPAVEPRGMAPSRLSGIDDVGATGGGSAPKRGTSSPVRSVKRTCVPPEETLRTLDRDDVGAGLDDTGEDEFGR
ncbi:armadillo-type protein, partial [Blyttiomyces helicus]